MRFELELADGKIVFTFKGNATYNPELFKILLQDENVRKFFKALKKSDLQSHDINQLLEAALQSIKLTLRGQDAAAVKVLTQALLFETDFTTIFIKQLYGFEPTAENIIAYAMDLAYRGNEEIDYARLSVYKSRVRLTEMFAQVFQKELDGAISRMQKDIVGQSKADIKLSKYFNPNTILNKLNMHSSYRLNELLQLAETSSPLEELSLIYSIKVSGPDGLKEEQEVRDLGILPKENFGIISAYDTPENNNTSRVNRLTLGAIVQNYIGSLTNINKDLFESSYAILSPLEATIPFIEHNDGNRILLATNQMKSIIPTEKVEPPIIQSGAEEILPQIASNIFMITAEQNGIVKAKTDKYIIVHYEDGSEKFIDVNARVIRTGKGFYTLPFKVLVKEGDTIKAGDIIATSTYITENGKMQLGNNVLIAFMHYEGQTYEDGIVVSESYAKKIGKTRKYEIVTIPIFEGEKIEYLNIEFDKFLPSGRSLITISMQSLEAAEEFELNPADAVYVDIKGNKKIYKSIKGGRIKEVQIYFNTKDINKIVANEEIKKQLLSLYEKFKPVYEDYLNAYLNHEPATDSKYLVKAGNEKYYYDDKVPLAIIRIEFEKVTYAALGDKLCNRHGNKGVITKILPDELMPKTEYGETIDVILDPLGVINRMNLGQVYEAAVAYICKHIYLRYLKDADLDTFKKVYDEFYRDFYLNSKEINAYLNALTTLDYKRLFDEAKRIEALPLIVFPFKSPLKQDQNLIKKLETKYKIKTEQKLYIPEYNTTTPLPVQIGYMYLFRLEHTTDEVLHARFIGARESLTGQAVKGRKKGGGFAFGEFDSWALLSYDVPSVVAEIGFVNAESEDFNDVLSSIIQNGKANLPVTTKQLPSEKLLQAILTALYLRKA
mgnify:CR=1 FL=1